MARAQQNWGAFVLQLIGSLVFLGVVFAGLAGSAPSGGVFAGSGSFWAPVFVGAAVIASVALFFASFGQITGWSGPQMSLMGLETAAVAGLTLSALTWGNSTWLWASVLGFVLTFLGSAMSGKRM
ncbi:MAG: hypothetical protein KGH57_00125 [Candidatus Micrarchaeota archaeon]|nr:hypothetical protein [Candidatus Micrarchaeota archaeon]